MGDGSEDTCVAEAELGWLLSVLACRPKLTGAGFLLSASFYFSSFDSFRVSGATVRLILRNPFVLFSAAAKVGTLFSGTSLLTLFSSLLPKTPKVDDGSILLAGGLR